MSDPLPAINVATDNPSQKPPRRKATAAKSRSTERVWSIRKDASIGTVIVSIVGCLAAAVMLLVSIMSPDHGAGWAIVAVLLAQCYQLSALKRQVMSVEESIREAHKIPIDLDE